MQNIKYTAAILFLILQSVLNNSCAQWDGDDWYKKNPGNVEGKYYFAFNLVETGDGRLSNYAVIKVNEDSTVHVTRLTEADFILQIGGKQESKANPDRENLWAKYQVDYATLYDLWKLRYSEHPYSQRPIAGWAKKKFGPSDEQIEFLRPYGIDSFTNFIYGEKAFKLLYDMQDPAWINKYTSL